MAVIREDTIVAPSVNTKNSATTLDSVTVEPGIYIVFASKTINNFTANKWTVICLADELASGPTCSAQIWIPAATGGTTQANQKMYLRTIASGGTGYGAFTTMVNENYFVANAIVNKSNNPAELYIQSTAPSTASGKNIIWIDTSS